MAWAKDNSGMDLKNGNGIWREVGYISRTKITELVDGLDEVNPGNPGCLLGTLYLSDKLNSMILEGIIIEMLNKDLNFLQKQINLDQFSSI